MLRNLWNRLFGRDQDAVVERETELEQMSPGERQVATESVDDIAADEAASERLGAPGSESLFGEND